MYWNSDIESTNRQRGHRDRLVQFVRNLIRKMSATDRDSNRRLSKTIALSVAHRLQNNESPTESLAPSKMTAASQMKAIGPPAFIRLDVSKNFFPEPCGLVQMTN
jgi:hypothetical protein